MDMLAPHKVFSAYFISVLNTFLRVIVLFLTLLIFTRSRETLNDNTALVPERERKEYDRL